MMSKRKYYLMTFNEDWADEHDVPALECMDEELFEEWKKCKHSVRAYLGNNSDYFCEDIQGQNGAQLMESVVDVTEVNKSFYDTFHKAGLSGLSLSNIFENEWEEDNDE